MSNAHTKTDVILIGAGIMSATLGTLLKELKPDWDILVFEKLAQPSEESSNEWNNAGTGHSALCELNYTPEKPDGSIDIRKAVKINEQFQRSKQFWAYLVKNRRLGNPQDFIRPLPHLSFVQGKHNVDFLRRRFEALSQHPLFHGMEFSDDPDRLSEWIPLMMRDRPSTIPIAATKIDTGTDVNFGALTRRLFDRLALQNVEIRFRHRVDDIQRSDDGLWHLKVHNLERGTVEHYAAQFVFIGAGGGSLPLLQKSGIPEGRHIGGFPVSGLFMVCHNPDLVAKHHAKVYGKAALGAPPMSVPHLDTRYIDGKKMLLFGPFAGFSPKFLKSGSWFDLVGSVKLHNLLTMLAAGVKNMDLTKYLIEQVMLSKEQRMSALREFVPAASSKDWDLIVAGQRVQVIKDTVQGGRGTLEFGTEVVTAADGSIAALLGASPGASTSVQVMLEVLERCFPQSIQVWEPKLREMIPSYGVSMADDPERMTEIDSMTSRVLGLTTGRLEPAGLHVS